MGPEELLRYLHDPGTTFEVCVIRPRKLSSPLWTGRANGRRPVVAGWFQNMEKAARLIEDIDKIGAEGIYTTLNPCHPAMLSRACERLEAHVERTPDAYIAGLRNLLIDLDPRRPSGVSTSDAEHQAALEIGEAIMADLSRAGWPEPLVGDSGNGAHLIYPLALENTPDHVDLLKRVLTGLAERYQNDLEGRGIELDTTVYNPARLTRVYGTFTRKGDNTPERPHRRARILHLPEKRLAVPRGLLEVVATPAQKQKEQGQTGGPGRLDVAAYLAHYGVEVVKIKPHGGGQLFCLATCVFNTDHRGNEAAIFQGSDGRLRYQCFHNSCQDRTWAEARRVISGDDPLTRFWVGGEAGRHFSNNKNKNSSNLKGLQDRVEKLLREGGIPEDIITQLVDFLGKSGEKRNIAQEVRDWVSTSTGYFLTSDCFRELGLTSRDFQKAAVLELLRLKNKGIIEPCGNRRGCYRLVERSCEAIDFLNAPDGPPLPLRWPLELERLVKLYPKNLAVVAGSKDAGKTAFCLNFARMNQDNFEVHYFCSEIAAQEFRERLKLFGFPLDSWKFKVWERTCNFVDVIRPDAINIIDYLEITDNFYLIAQELRTIYDKLRNGVALVAIQKDSNAKLGRGATFSLEKARLYVTIDAQDNGNLLTIISGKNWASDRNQRGVKIKFKLVNGAKIISLGEV